MMLFLEVNYENKKKFLNNSCEERIALISYMKARSNSIIRQDINKINFNDNILKDIARLDNLFNDFE